MRLALEPWCYTPDVIANLTWPQAENLYLLPAIEMAENAQHGDKPQVDDECPTWPEFVASYGAAFIGKPESEMRKAYDRFAADILRSQREGK